MRGAAAAWHSPAMTALPTAPRVLVVGAGGIGGIIAAHLAEAEVDVTAVTTNPTIRAAIESGAAEIVEDG